jgi:hypothetical protein
MRLPPRTRNLAIDYTALSLSVPEKVRFRFKLDGQDQEWREVVNQRHVEYSNLPERRRCPADLYVHRLSRVSRRSATARPPAAPPPHKTSRCKTL